MAYINGKYVCDQCGAVKSSINSSKWKVFVSGDAICGNCLEKRKLMKEQSKLIDLQKKQIKEVSKDSSSDDENKSSKLFIFFKWLFCIVWGGPYILIKSIPKKSKFWIIMGIEFTVVFILTLITSNFFETGSKFHWTNYITIPLMGINIFALIYFYKTKPYEN